MARAGHDVRPCPIRLRRRGIFPIYAAGRRSVAQPGRALLSGGRGRRFKSSHSDQSINRLDGLCYDHSTPSEHIASLRWRKRAKTYPDSCGVARSYLATATSPSVAFRSPRAPSLSTPTRSHAGSDACRPPRFGRGWAVGAALGDARVAMPAVTASRAVQRDKRIGTIGGMHGRPARTRQSPQQKGAGGGERLAAGGRVRATPPAKISNNLSLTRSAARRE
jgi:hypothetical protein